PADCAGQIGTCWICLSEGNHAVSPPPVQLVGTVPGTISLVDCTRDLGPRLPISPLTCRRGQATNEPGYVVVPFASFASHLKSKGPGMRCQLKKSQIVGRKSKQSLVSGQ